MPTSPHGRRPRRLLIPIAILLTIAATTLVRPPIAFAGTYTVHSCQTPTGRWTGMAGWTSSASTPFARHDNGASSACSSRTSASLQFGGSGLSVVSGGWLQWSLVAPENTAIATYRIERGFDLAWPAIARAANRPYVLQIWQGDDLNAGIVDFKSPLLAGDTLSEPPSEIQGANVDWDSLHIRLSCWGLVGSLDCGPFPATVTIPRAEFGLVDVDAPVTTVTGGALVGGGPVRGTAQLEFGATDEGGGVYRVALSVDGHEKVRRVVDDEGGACADVEPGNGDPYEFGAPQPCPLAVADGAVQLETATLADGHHAVRVTVEDVAGNTDVVFDGTVQTHNAPINVGAPVLGGHAGVGAQLTVAPGQWDGAPTGYDHRWLRCNADGHDCTPVAGASGPTYVPTAADAYHRMRAEVTAANGSGAASAQSAPSALVADAAGRTTPLPGNPGGGSGASAPAPGPGHIDGLVNPLAQQPGHVANGTSASPHARIVIAFQRADGGSARRVRSTHGRRTTIAGRLTDGDGSGIGGARLGAAWKVTGRGWVARPGVTTAHDGRFVYDLPPGPSRAVRFTYFPFSDSRAAELSNVVHVDVRAPLTIAAGPKRVGGERVVRLSGRVGGGAIPRGGVLVTLQGFQQGWGWRAFRTVRTTGDGRWSTRYRFRLSSGHFGFRALVPQQQGFPFVTSRSRGTFVRVG